MTARTLFRITDIHEIPVHLARESADLLRLTIKPPSRQQHVRLTHAHAAQLAAALSGAPHRPGRLTELRDVDGDDIGATREPEGPIRLAFFREDADEFAEFTDTDAAELAAALAAAAGVPDIIPTPKDADEFAESGMPPRRILARVVDRLGDGDAVTIAEELDTGALIVAITYGDRDGFAPWVQISDESAARIAAALTRRQPRNR
ncbi:hypothetical protein [Nocardia sp. NPDC004860]|uniref:hypothetical protein n=1 Tax=Nocardia sp. NPDC004860 TaxID=3154557 RepID=UPI0033A88D6E